MFTRMRMYQHVGANQKGLKMMDPYHQLLPAKYFLRFIKKIQF